MLVFKNTQLKKGTFTITFLFMEEKQRIPKLLWFYRDYKMIVSLTESFLGLKV